MSSRIKELVDKLVSPSRIAERLERYPAIAKHFGQKQLTYSRPPYYCHAMAWRLGTWESEEVFERLDQLLTEASKLPGWSRERGLFSNGDFSAFWNLLWQLQVAEWLTGHHLQASWQNPGPDLKTHVAGTPISVECYSAIGKYAPVLFLEELLGRLHADLQVDYDPIAFFSAHPSSVGIMLEECIVAVDAALAGAEKDAARGPWPVLLYSSRQGKAIEVRLKGGDIAHYEPSLDRIAGADPKSYYPRVLQAALGAKEGKNDLSKYHPNVVLINMAVQEEFQMAAHVLKRLQEVPTGLALPSNLDGAAWTIAGIDEKARFVAEWSEWRLQAHPLRDLLDAS